MTKARERIWTWKYTGDHNNGGWSRSKLAYAEAEYIRADLSDALIAAAYEAAATEIRKMDNGRGDGKWLSALGKIRALTPDDARAALERVVKEAKGETP